ncbi:hypothetical protein EWM64_g2380 [Hericium alpestre]|uniref:Translation machinery-associated protein 16 n=1 Tax=Hericium alpestre TaxID=135208 RepID=A0A4Z0A3N3_9AGAM|nr:hypothetical protein EWM64_g2380 [Hericium alpestre]
MAPSKQGKTGDKGGKKEKVFHPESRKAGQLVRSSLRQTKLRDQASKRWKKHSAHVNLFGFWYHALPEEGVLTLEEMHALIRDVWLVRHDSEIEEEKAARRKGRPKSTKEQKLEEIKRREAEEYRAGMDVLDLTHPDNVALFRNWDQIEVAYPQMLRFIRITSEKPDIIISSRPGQHPLLKEKPVVEDQAMDVVPPAPLASEPVERFSSTMMAMDVPV